MPTDQRSVEEVQESEEKPSWVKKIKKTLREIDGSDNLSIYKVPSRLRSVMTEAYSPRVLTIGPLPPENYDDFAFMRGHKSVYMLFFFQKTPHRSDSHKLLEKCASAIHNYKDFNKIVRGWYSGKLKIKARKLAQMMLVDACFILELFLRYDQYCKNIKLEGQSDDPIFSNAWMIPALRHDLALLENQIPFFILELLYDILKRWLMNRCELPHSVTSLALNFFQPMNQYAMTEQRNAHDCKHLLDLLHSRSILPYLEYIVSLPPNFAQNRARKVQHSGTEINRHPDGRLSINLTLIELSSRNEVEPNSQFVEAVDPESKQKRGWGFAFCATELVETGIKFQKQSSEGPLLNMEFRNGVIRNIPPMSIYETADFSLLRNLIAYEQCSLHRAHQITSFASLMNSLIRSSWDITLLRREGILNHNKVEDEEYFARFKNILDEVVVKDFCYLKLCDEVNSYARKFWFWRGVKSIYRTHFSTAWSMISFFAATCLFALTIVQTYFAINPRN